ncbi:DUF2933 domain-containing protein [Alicyclobacillus tolerans]|uniref:DUF2933 domain-containing protein n=1 Tax=Alicyclobacillus tolerans TaxID=90970 RepID=UPI0035581CE7|nr:DUF2933 domain-containing protein [Alicyclobacillus tolerans]
MLRERRAFRNVSQTLSTIVIALICPQMMIFMMRGMHGQSNSYFMHRSSTKRFASREEEFQELRECLIDLHEAQYDQLSSEPRR